MELIVASFLATILSFVGHFAMAVANRRPARRAAFPYFGGTPHPASPPPSAKRSTVLCTAARAEPVTA
jgi:hypothetical protein